jgi:NAD(P)-dependent dehydrogenase (short-subunit alcohol dehydrogenase family)
MDEETIRMIEEVSVEAAYRRADVSKPADCQALVNFTIERFGKLDILLKNAGIGSRQNPTADYSIEGWNKLLSINLSGVFYCMKYELPTMLQTRG